MHRLLYLLLISTLSLNCGAQEAEPSNKTATLEGIQETFYANGQLKSSGNYITGLKEGLHKEWWKNGALSAESIYVNGKINGLIRWYNEDGVLVAQGNMKNGLRDGLWKICDYSEPTICIDAAYKMEQKHGLWKVYHDNGQLKEEAHWQDNKK